MGRGAGGGGRNAGKGGGGAGESPISGGGIANTVSGGGNLSDDQIQALRKMDGTWHTIPQEGSQSTPRSVRLNFWQRGEDQRMYINTRIESRTSRLGDAGYINLRTGEINGNRSEISGAIRSIAQGRDTWSNYRGR